MPESEKQSPDLQSRSQRKREMTDLQKLGEKLTQLPKTELAHLPVPDELKEAILLFHTLKTHESKRRHLQYIGKLMREVDAEPIQTAIKKYQLKQTKDSSHFKQIEQWRDRLIEEGDPAIQLFVTTYTQTNREQLRQLVRQARRDVASQKDSGTTTLLFRFIREMMDSDIM